MTIITDTPVVILPDFCILTIVMVRKSNSSADSIHQNPTFFSRKGVWTGIKQMLPLGVFIIPYGLSFGVVALENGLSALQAIAISAFVFAGSAQFAALTFLEAPMRLLPLALTVLAISSRHIVMGAALTPWLRHLTAPQRMMSLFVLSDANHASSYRAFLDGEKDTGVLFGGGLVLWSTWVSGTALGAFTGDSFGDLDRFGIDVVVAAYFSTVILGKPIEKRMVFPYLIAAIVASVGWYLLPVGWNIIVAAVMGGLVGVVTHGT